MNREEALGVLKGELAAWRGRSYAALASQIDVCSHTEVSGLSGVKYQIDIRPIWDDRPGGVIRVLGLVDDGGVRAFFPLSDDFLIAPDGTFVGEEAV